MKILVVDDDRSSLDAVSRFLKDPLGYEVFSCSDCISAFEVFKKELPQIILSDIKMPGLNGLDLLRQIKGDSHGHNTEVILMTGFGDLNSCIEALREGAADYILKPIYVNHLELVINRLLGKRELEKSYHMLQTEYDRSVQEVERCNSEVSKWKQLYGDIIEKEQIGVYSSALRDILSLALKYHKSKEIPVLIEGDTGTGKEIIANVIHSGGKASTKPFIEVNCAAISPSLFESEMFGYEEGAFTGARARGKMGKLELAQGGTIFLDEISELQLDMQSKLLRAIQHKEFFRVGGTRLIKINVRFVFATNRSLKEAVGQERFREDLYYRINYGYIYLPPLRERKEEIAPLALMFLRQSSKRLGKAFDSISREAVAVLEDYDFPGNVRELKNIIERVCIIYDDKVLRTEHLNFMDVPLVSEEIEAVVLNLVKEEFPLREMEYQIARKVLERFRGNVSKSAQYLNIAWATMVKMARLKKK